MIWGRLSEKLLWDEISFVPHGNENDIFFLFAAKRYLLNQPLYKLWTLDEVLEVLAQKILSQTVMKEKKGKRKKKFPSQMTLPPPKKSVILKKFRLGGLQIKLM